MVYGLTATRYGDLAKGAGLATDTLCYAGYGLVWLTIHYARLTTGATLATGWCDHGDQATDTLSCAGYGYAPDVITGTLLIWLWVYCPAGGGVDTDTLPYPYSPWCGYRYTVLLSVV